MFKKFLSKIGIGAATVNLVLDQQTARVGEEVTGTLQIQGGKVPQHIKAVYVNLYIKAQMGDKTAHRKIASIKAGANIRLISGQNLRMPFRYTLPELPQSSKYVSYSFQSSLDIPGALDPLDFDAFNVQPRAEVEMVQQALQSLGFQEKYESGEFNGYYQEFEYKATSSPFKGRIDELEIVMLPGNAGVELHIELDKRGRGLSGFLAEALDMDEQYAVIVIPIEQLTTREAAQKALGEFLEGELNNPHPSRTKTLPRISPTGQLIPPHGQTYGLNEKWTAGLAGGFVGYMIGTPIFTDDHAQHAEIDTYQGDTVRGQSGYDDYSGGDTGSDYGGGDFGGGDFGGGGGGDM